MVFVIALFIILVVTSLITYLIHLFVAREDYEIFIIDREEEYNKGYHFYYDWDGLFIGPDSPEWGCCTCHPLKKQIGEIDEHI